MYVPGNLTLACVVARGLTAAPVAEAASAHKPKHHVARKAVVKRNNAVGGATVQTQDVDGDGNSDVVASDPAKPKPKPKKN